MNIATNIAPAMTQDTATASLRDLLIERNALMERLNRNEDTADENDPALGRVNVIEAAILSRIATTADDVIVKLIALAQVNAEGASPRDDWNAQAIMEARRFLGAGYVYQPVNAAAVAIPLDAALECGWEQVHARYRQTMAVFRACPEEPEDTFHKAISAFADATKALMLTPAPTLAALKIKAAIFDAEQAWELGEDGAVPLAITADFRRLLPEPRDHDRAILDAFAARRRDFAETYDADMTREEEDAYYQRLDAYDAVLEANTATTIEGVIAKLLTSLKGHSGSQWGDMVIMNTTDPDFVAGIANDDFYTRLEWSAIQDLARIGSVKLPGQEGSFAPISVPVSITTPVSPFDALRLEYIDLDHRLNTSAPSDDDPRIDAWRARMNEIEDEMTLKPSRSTDDAKTKLRFMLDTDRIGVPLDGREAHVLIKDAARFLLGEGVAA